MGARGPAPTPTAILEARGSPLAAGRRGEPRARGALPVAPSWLDDEALAAWTYVVAQLGALGIVGEVDQHALALFCSTWSRWRRLDRFLRDHGETFIAKSREGDERPTLRPEAGLAVALLAELRNQGDRLGLNPSARTRLNVAVAAPVGKKPKPWEVLPGSAGGAAATPKPATGSA